MTSWTSQIFKDSDNAEDALCADRAGLVKHDEIRALIPRRIWTHIIHSESSAQIKGVEDLFIHLNTDPNADGLRRLINDYFVNSPPLTAHLRNPDTPPPPFPDKRQPAVTLEPVHANHHKCMEEIENLPRVAEWFDSSSKEKCLPHTRVSILDSIQSCLVPGRSSFMWLRGSPGTGKSTIAKTITARLEEEKRLASAIYFDKTFGHDNSFSTLHFISSIAYQIAKFNSAFCEVLGRVLSEDGGIRKHADWAGHIEQLLEKPLSHLPSLTTASWVVVIDALDECGSRAELRELMDVLGKFAELPLTFLVTSRPEPEVIDQMDGPELSPRVTAEDLDTVDQASANQDIFEFVKSRVQRLRNSRDRAWPPSDDQLTQFVARCSGLFELASILLRSLERGYQYGLLASERFKRLLTEADGIASDPDSALYSEYCRILERAYPVGSSQEAQEGLQRYQMVVGSLVLLREPMTAAALADLLGMTEDDVWATLMPLGSVIWVPECGSISLYHASFHEFLVPSSGGQQRLSGEESPTRLRYRIVIQEQESHLASRCLEIMNAELVYNICHVRDLFVLNYKMFPPPFSTIYAQDPLPYVVLHWAEHLARSGDSAQLQDLLRCWCEEKMLFYLEFMSLLDRSDAISFLLNNAIEWAEKTGETSDSAMLMRQCNMYVQICYQDIRKSAGCVYSSIMPRMFDCKFHFMHTDPVGYAECSRKKGSGFLPLH